MKTMMRRTMTAVTVLGVLLFAGISWGDEPKPAVSAANAAAQPAAPAAVVTSATIDLPVLSAYVWRGQVLNDQAVLQPALTLTRGDFSVQAWFNMNFTDRVTGKASQFSEVDLGGTYSHRVGPASLSVGYIEYMFPNQTVFVTAPGSTTPQGEAVKSTREVYLSVTCPDWIVVPALTVYRDVGEGEGTYAQAALAWTKPVCSNVSFTLSGSAGYADATYDAFYFGVDKAAVSDGNIGAMLAIKATDAITITPMVQYTVLFDSTVKEAAKNLYRDDQRLFGGVKLTWGM